MAPERVSAVNGVHKARRVATTLDPQAKTVRHTIDDLGVQGLLSEQKSSGAVASFRGLKYARIPGRWHESVLVDFTSQRGDLDATQWGPRPPQTVDIMHHMTGHLYPRMSTYDAMSEWECLNLNVYSPVTALEAAADAQAADVRLPVIVWVHGGSFEWGDGGCECDSQYLVSHSIQMGQPVIVVGINYRLGTLGFLTSKELRQEARARGEAGYSNLGLYDQRVALQWVKHNIHFFGGDASRITLAGESAGAVSAFAHLRGTEPVAKCALLMSPATIYPRTFAETQVTFDRICDELGLTGEPDDRKLAALRELPCERLHVLGADRLETILCEDPIFFAAAPAERFEDMSTYPPWISRVVVGNTKEELAIMGHYWGLLPQRQLLDAWRHLYQDPEYASQVLTVYGVHDMEEGDTAISARSTDQGKRLVQALVEYTSDALFSKAVRSIAETHLTTAPTDVPRSRPQVYLYRFDQDDTLTKDEAQYGHAYHSLDNAFFFHFPQVAGPDASEDFRNTADAFSGAVVRLAHEDTLWQPLGPRDHAPHNTFATFSGRGLEEGPLADPKWASLANTPEKVEQFLLGKDLMFKLGALAFKVAHTSASDK